MKNRKLQGKVLLLLIMGLLAIAIPQIVRHYIELSDVVLGSLMGIGIGLLLVALAKMKRSY